MRSDAEVKSLAVDIAKAEAPFTFCQILTAKRIQNEMISSALCRYHLPW